METVSWSGEWKSLGTLKTGTTTEPSLFKTFKGLKMGDEEAWKKNERYKERKKEKKQRENEQNKNWNSAIAINK